MLPERLLNYEFSRSFKGYKPEQVEEYIEELLGMYEELSNENKELSMRYDLVNAALTASKEKVELAESTIAQRDKMLSDASEECRRLTERTRKESEELMSETENRARAIKEKAEEDARILVLEARGRADGIEAAAEAALKAAQLESEKTIDDAMKQAKQLVRATKASCAKRQKEADDKLLETMREHDALRDKIADFRCKVFEAYSNQLLILEGVEIPERLCEPEPDDDTPETTVQVIAASGSADSCETEQPQQIGESEPEPEPESESQPEVENEPEPEPEPETETEPEPEPEPERPVLKNMGYRTSFAGIEIETEYSGQVRFDTTDISSVNKTLDGIIEKRMQSNPGDAQKKPSPDKFGFLK